DGLLTNSVAALIKNRRAGNPPLPNGRLTWLTRHSQRTQQPSETGAAPIRRRAERSTAMISLEGKIALVTGGGGGIGRGIAESLGSYGAKVAVAELKQDRADAVEAALKSAKADHMVVRTDVRQEAQVNDLMKQIEQRYGQLDILVNNVGTASAPKLFEFTTNEDWDFDYQINLRHMFLVTRAAIPLIRKTGKGGSIINLSSIEAFRGIPLMTVYGAFKAAVIGFTMSLALELGHE